MNVDYGIFVLRTHINNLQDRLAEIEEGGLNRHPKEQVDKLKEEIIEKEKSLYFTIEQLEKLEKELEEVCECGFPYPPQPVNRPMSGKLRQVTKDCIKCGKSNTWKYRK